MHSPTQPPAASVRRSVVLSACLLAVSVLSCEGSLDVNVDGEPITDIVRESPSPRTPGTETEPGTEPLPGELVVVGELDTYSRLTKQEYRYVVLDMLKGLYAGVAAPALRAIDRFNENNYSGFYKNYNPISVSPGLEVKQFEFAKSLAAAFVETDQFTALCASGCYAGITDSLVPRLWKRRLTEEERVEMRALYDQFPAESREELLLVRVFASPYFHYKIFSPSPETDDAANIQRGQLLSFLLTGSYPDDELQAAIDDGSIADQEVTRGQITRLLEKHPDRFATLFVPQWLGVASLYETDSDFDGVPLRTVMTEPAMIFAEMLRNEQPISRLVALDYNIVDALLAELYGTSALTSDGWSKQAIIPSLFGTAALTYLTVDHETNYPSPIRRGSYIVNHLLCRNIQFPPADLQSEVDRIVQSAPADLSPPARMEYFRSFPACASCHNQFDHHGLALEEIGAFGRERDGYYTGDPIEVGGTVEGITYDSSVDYSNQLARMPELNTCFASQVYAYATSESHLTANREFQHVESELAGSSANEIVTEMLLAAFGEK